MQNAVTGTYPVPSRDKAEQAQEHLLVRYARGRISHFGARQVMTVIGGLMLSIAYGPWVGFAAVALALFGELLDCGFLRTIENRLQGGATAEKLAQIATITAATQAVTIAVCVAMAWLKSGDDGQLFPAAFLTGAALNAGLVLPYARGASIVRLSIYAMTALGLMVRDAFFAESNDVGFYMNLSGVLILTFVVYAFFDFVFKGAERHRANVTELEFKQRQIEEANRRLREREKEAQRLSLVARNANDSIFLCDPTGHITWVNEGFTRVTGYTAEDAIGRSAGDLLNGSNTDLKSIQAMSRALKRGEPFRGEVRNVTKDGREIWIETNQVPVFDASGNIETIVAIERDITENKKYARDLARAKEHAEMGARAKAEFLANMSHEIRTPMNGIIGMADLLCESRLDPDQKTYADTIRGSAQGLLTIINDVLDLSKLDAEKLVLHPVDFELKACVSDVFMLFATQARDKEISLRLDLANDLPGHVHADEARLRQLLINLVGNAVKFTESGEVEIKVSRRDDTRGMLLDIAVRDTGIGIGKEELESIFVRFNQAEASTTRRFGGTGLGLTISRMLTELMGGEISVTSTVGEGSCFSLSLPVGAPQRPARAFGKATPDPLRLDSLRGKRILVAEDNRVNRLLVEKFLSDLPLELSFAVDGTEAVTKTQQGNPDLILMDMSMPRQSGIEAAREIRENDGIAQPIIIALTANAFASDRTACLDAGMDGFLTKPIRRSELLAELLRFCPAPVEGQEPAPH